MAIKKQNKKDNFSKPISVRLDESTKKWIIEEGNREHRKPSDFLRHLIYLGIDVRTEQIKMSLGADLKVALRHIEEDRAAAESKLKRAHQVEKAKLKKNKLPTPK
ncbi:hypothetical protein ES708_25562 [subsurface metagenome]